VARFNWNYRDNLITFAIQFVNCILYVLLEAHSINSPPPSGNLGW
jgi:hypothetical protein